MKSLKSLLNQNGDDDIMIDDDGSVATSNLEEGLSSMKEESSKNKSVLKSEFAETNRINVLKGEDSYILDSASVSNFR
jgi:hypothetical protein